MGKQKKTAKNNQWSEASTQEREKNAQKSAVDNEWSSGNKKKG